jgi:hypothetical protein
VWIWKNCGVVEKYAYCGHTVLMGKRSMDWQNTAYILRHFNSKLSTARRRYHDFVQKGVAIGKKSEMSGGGLVRSSGGWGAVKSLRKTGALQKGDERILGDGEFVDCVLSQAKEAFEEKYRLKAGGVDVGDIAERVAEIVGIPSSEIWSSGKSQQRVLARDLLCYWATSRLGVTQAWLSKKIGLSQPAVSLSVNRGRRLVIENQYRPETYKLTYVPKHSETYKLTYVPKHSRPQTLKHLFNSSQK